MATLPYKQKYRSFTHLSISDRKLGVSMRFEKWVGWPEQLEKCNGLGLQSHPSNLWNVTRSKSPINVKQQNDPKADLSGACYQNEPALLPSSCFTLESDSTHPKQIQDNRQQRPTSPTFWPNTIQSFRMHKPNLKIRTRWGRAIWKLTCPWLKSPFHRNPVIQRKGEGPWGNESCGTKRTRRIPNSQKMTLQEHWTSGTEKDPQNKNNLKRKPQIWKCVSLSLSLSLSCKSNIDTKKVPTLGNVNDSTGHSVTFSNSSIQEKGKTTKKQLSWSSNKKTQ